MYIQKGVEMKIKALLSVSCFLFTGWAAAASNVALGGVVSLTGAGFNDSGYWGGANPAAPSTVVDGVFLPLGTQWNTGTVFWSGAFGADTVLIDLPTAAKVTHIDLQADNNDDYGIAFKDIGGVWHDLTTISPHRSWGMDMGQSTFGEVTATAFAIKAVGGDGYYSVSEFQAIGAPVPEPESIALLLAGLGVVGFVARRKAV